ncbi:MAG: hypothetical protein LBI44_02430 [Oscillospiraceae bacterium]|nr:hypothetical protein [Oscillospiraceae bacterium]
MPNYGSAVVPRDKIRQYYLKPGTNHFEDFAEVGYTAKHAKRLEQDLLDGLKENNVVLRIEDERGMLYTVYMELGITKKRTFLTAWIIEKGGPPRNITAYRRERPK